MPEADRQKQRRRYLKHAAKVYGKAGLGVVLNVCLAGIATTVGLSLLYWQGIDFGKSYSPEQSPFPVFLFIGAIIIVGSWLNYRSHALVEKAQQEAARLYVPPVTPEGLPDEEILVRGADKPYQEPELTLLREAMNPADLSADQLLRPEAKQAHERLYQEGNPSELQVLGSRTARL